MHIYKYICLDETNVQYSWLLVFHSQKCLLLRNLFFVKFCSWRNLDPGWKFHDKNAELCWTATLNSRIFATFKQIKQGDDWHGFTTQKNKIKIKHGSGISMNGWFWLVLRGKSSTIRPSVMTTRGCNHPSAGGPRIRLQSLQLFKKILVLVR